MTMRFQNRHSATLTLLTASLMLLPIGASAQNPSPTPTADAARFFYPLAPLTGSTPKFVVDTSETPNDSAVKAWAEQARALCEAWYPLVSAFLATESAKPRKTVRLVFVTKSDAPAYASGDSITVKIPHIKANPSDFGMMIHEMTHIIQAYPDSKETPGWLVEGIADYIRYYKYEPEKPHRKIDPTRSDYHDGYSVTPGFLAWIVYKYDRRIVHRLDKALRDGNYSPDIWAMTTGKSLDDLWKEFAGTLTTAP